MGPDLPRSAVREAAEPAALDQGDRIAKSRQSLPDLRRGRVAQAPDLRLDARARLVEQGLPVAEPEPAPGREGQPVEVVTD